MDPSLQEISLAVQERWELNSQAPIFKLSDDLLSHLFDSFSPSGESMIVHADIISVSQVCYLWRVIALNLPTLWRSVTFSPYSIQWGREFLRRSSKAPFIFLYCARGTSDEAIATNPGIGSRIRQLSGHISARAWTLLCDEAQHPEAQLQCLSLNHPNPDSNYWEDTQGLPPVIFKGHVPPLRTVYLNYCYVDMRSPFFGNVTALHLNITEPCQISIDEFSSAMEHMPLLEQLRIEEALLPLPLGEFPIISIPNLQYFSFYDDNDDLDRLIARLVIPESCILDLHGLRPIAMENTQKAFINRIILDYRNNRNVSLNIRSDRYRFSIDNYRFMDPGLCNNEIELFDSIGVVLRVGTTEDYHDPAFIFHSFTSALEEVLSNITFLTLGISEYKLIMLPSLFRFQNVQHLRLPVAGQDMQFLSCQRTSGPEPVNSSDGISFSSLKTMVVEPRIAENPEYVEHFISLLRWRSEHGAPIIRLDYEYSRRIETEIATGHLFRDKIQAACPEVEVRIVSKT